MEVYHARTEKGNYENEVEYLVLDSPKLIVWDRISQPLFRVVATFEATNDGKTLLTFRMQFATEKECDKIRKFALIRTKKISINWRLYWQGCNIPTNC